MLSLGGDSSFGYRELETSVRAILGGAAFYGSNRDGTFPTADGPSPGAGALIAAVEYATRTRARCAGKPEAGMFHEAQRLLGDGSYLMVGDRLDADVAGARAAGLDAALVLTGSTSAEDAAAWDGPQPVVVLGSIAELPAYL